MWAKLLFNKNCFESMIFHQNLSERAEERNNCWFYSWSTALQQIDFQIFFVEISSFSCVKQITVKCETKRKLVLALSGETAALKEKLNMNMKYRLEGETDFSVTFQKFEISFLSMVHLNCEEGNCRLLCQYSINISTQISFQN